ARSDYLDATTFPTFQNIANGFLLPALTNDYYATVGVKLTQPLLKDGWIDLYRRNIQLNKKNLQISELTLKSNIMNVVTTVATAYYDLIFAREQVNVERKALDLAKRLLQDTHRKVEAGTLTRLDEQQAESDVETI